MKVLIRTMREATYYNCKMGDYVHIPDVKVNKRKRDLNGKN